MKRPFFLLFLAIPLLLRVSTLGSRWALNQAILNMVKGRDGQLLLETAVRYDQTNDRAWWQLGKVLAQKGNVGTAVLSWQAAPNSGHWLLEYGRAEAEANRNWQAAQPWFERAIQVDPQSAEAHYWLGRTFYEIGHFGEAQQALETAVSLASDHIHALTYLSNTHAQQGNITEAETVLLQTAEQFPDDPEIAMTLGNLYRSQGNLIEAAYWLEQAAHHPHHTVQTLLDLVLVYHTMGKPKAALPYAEQAVQEAPFSTAAQNLLNETHTLLQATPKSE